MRLNATIAIDGQAMAMNLNQMPIDNDITLGKFEMNFECFRIASKCGVQIFCGNPRQVVPLNLLRIGL